MKFKHVGDHAEDLADGRLYGPGETFELDEDAASDPFNQDKIERGVFMSLDEKKAGAQASAAEKKGTE